jgi:hypothetical protein
MSLPPEVFTGRTCAAHGEVVGHLTQLHDDQVEMHSDLHGEISEMRRDLMAELKAGREASDRRATERAALWRAGVDLVREGLGIVRLAVERVTKPAVAVPLGLALIATGAGVGFAVTNGGLLWGSASVTAQHMP